MRARAVGLAQSLLGSSSSPAPLPAPCSVPQVGWPHKNVMRELLREPAGATLVLKKVPVPKTPPQVPAPSPAPVLLSDPCHQLCHHFWLFPQTSPQALGSPQRTVPSPPSPARPPRSPR